MISAAQWLGRLIEIARNLVSGELTKMEEDLINFEPFMFPSLCEYHTSGLTEMLAMNISELGSKLQ